MSFSQNRNLNLLSIVLLVLLPLLVYGRAAGFDFVNWDDDLYIYNNPAITAFSLENIRSWFTKPFISLYVPIPLFSYALDYEACGLNPACYHITNLLIHTANGLLVYWLFGRFFSNRLLCLLAALLFLFHPVQVESVAWLSQRKTLLSGFFIFLSFGAYLKTRGGKHVRLWWFLSSIGFLLSLASKPTAVCLPLIILIHSLYYKLMDRRAAVVAGLLFLVPAAAAGLFTLVLYPNVLNVASEAGAWDSLRWFAVITAFYAGHFFLMHGIDLFYLIPGFSSPASGQTFFYALPLAVLIIVWVLGLRRRAGYGFWITWFFAFLLPVMNVFPVPAGDRHMYVPIMGMAAAFVSMLERKPRLAAVLLFPVVLSCILISASRLGVWRNGESLWKSVKVEESSLQARRMTQLAGHYEDEGRIAEAEEIYWDLIATKPFIPYPYINLYNIYALRGSARTAEVEKAFAETYTRSLSLADVYKRLLEAKDDPEKVDAVIAEVIKKRFR